jgi:hypothetical protein
MVITMGLLSAPIQKLEEAWGSLANKEISVFHSLQKLLDVSHNMRYYRQKMGTAKAPCIPFLPVILKDRTFFKEGNASHLASHPDLVNFSKFRRIQQFVDTTRHCTSESYWFAGELEQPGGLDIVAGVIEARLDNVKTCYHQCELI